MAESYEKAGVNLEAGYEVVRRIKSHVASTSRLGVMGNIGSFGGMFDLSALNMKEPVLVSGTDGVGTKLKLAFAMDKHDTIGIVVRILPILHIKIHTAGQQKGSHNICPVRMIFYASLP